MQLRCGGILNDHIFVNFPQSVSVKEFLKSVSIWQSLVICFLTHTSGRSRICQRGDHGERAEREPKRGFGPPEAESFLYIFMQKSGQKLRI